MEACKEKEAIEEAKKLMMLKQYKSARDATKIALELSPSSTIRFGMLVVAETLYYAYIVLPDCGIDWYSILHLHPSTTMEQIKIRYEELQIFTTLAEVKSFPEAIEANSLLLLAMSTLCDESKRSEFDRKRKGCIFFDWAICNKKGKLRKQKGAGVITRKKYLEWKPPIYNVGIVTEEHDVVDNGDDGQESTGKRQKLEELPCPRCSVNGDPSLSPELRALKNKVFVEMPQRPHYIPLQNYVSTVREGLVFGLELAFVKLCEEVSSLVDPESFMSRLDCFKEQISQFEEMGYDVEKLKQQLDTLEGIAYRGRQAKADAEKFEVEVNNLEVEESNLQSRISELVSQLNEIKSLTSLHRSKLEVLKKNDTVTEFASAVKSLWKNEAS